MFRNILSPDNPVMITMNQITDCIFLSLFFLLCSLPVFTIGASCAALYDAVYRCFRCHEPKCWRRFFTTFLRDLKMSLIPNVIFVAVLFFGSKGLIALWNNAVYGNISWAIFSGGAFVGLLTVGILSVLFPLLSRFDNPLPRLLANTLALAMANLPRTLLLGLLNTITALLSIRWVYPLFFLPAVSTLIATLLLEPMFKPYMTENAA